ncbi:hypothetical protein AMATHDRAFT_8095 [Amanita thiersii Skay4041]|uniref:Uncharacterized protein n=1 Tax=Amanita thiersii Skay4041 TaxID=703135 RepID=A0A2A9N7R4_9AGAR|nr:hypothetical protein AMATHDRAFT_8095 [Amanita thiersii Skay4041]
MHFTKVPPILVCVSLMSCAAGMGTASTPAGDRMQRPRSGQGTIRRMFSMTSNQDGIRARSLDAVPTVGRTPEACLELESKLLVSKWIRDDGKCYAIDTAIKNFANEEGRCWGVRDKDPMIGNGSKHPGSSRDSASIKQYSGPLNAANYAPIHRIKAF